MNDFIINIHNELTSQSDRFSASISASLSIPLFLLSGEIIISEPSLETGINYTESHTSLAGSQWNDIYERIAEIFEQKSTISRSERKLNIQPIICSVEHKDIICSICQNQIENGEMMCLLECRHKFHNDCISEWICYKSECPNCRSSISTRQQ